MLITNALDVRTLIDRALAAWVLGGSGRWAIGHLGGYRKSKENMFAAHFGSK